MVIYLVCFNLGDTRDKQQEQLFFWLQFLNSSVPSSNNDKRNWRVMIVGLKADLMGESIFTSQSLSSWESLMSNLPIHQRLFCVSSLKSQEGVQELLSSIENVCSQIFLGHTILIPPSYRKLLHSLHSFDLSDYCQNDLLVPYQQLHELLEGEHNIDLATFKHALQYLHAIGQIVFLQTSGLVCRTPTTIPKLLAKFVSPVEIRNQLLAEESEVIQILTQQEIGAVLQTTSYITQYEIFNDAKLLSHF